MDSGTIFIRGSAKGGALFLLLMVRKMRGFAGELEVEFNRVSGIRRVGGGRKEGESKKEIEESSAGERRRGRGCSWPLGVSGGTGAEKKWGSGEVFWGGGKVW